MKNNGWHTIKSQDDLPKETAKYLVTTRSGGYYTAMFHADKKDWGIYSINAIIAWHKIPEYTR